MRSRKRQLVYASLMFPLVLACAILLRDYVYLAAMAIVLVILAGSHIAALRRGEQYLPPGPSRTRQIIGYGLPLATLAVVIAADLSGLAFWLTVGPALLISLIVLSQKRA